MRRGRKRSVAERFISRKRADEPSSDEKFPATLQQTSDDQLQHLSPRITLIVFSFAGYFVPAHVHEQDDRRYGGIVRGVLIGMKSKTSYGS
ncbi:hypothetical protein DPMN_006172 [Dreissena polymorpha]|uniref:Uncharacterized protein n=1 Tax=Dreissena polymorpha TaxID=45954 RepID=A0A9D4RX87_DREPO|nr:hypothetical protein DPMN_006172 [Dreissena polymorpha]